MNDIRQDDICVALTSEGFSIGRILHRGDQPKPGWEYIFTVPHQDEAIRAAVLLAHATSAAAWFYEWPRGTYRRL